MKLSLADARKLLLLREGRMLPASSFRNALSVMLQEEHILNIRSNKTRATCYVNDVKALDAFLVNKCMISDLVGYVELLSRNDLLRADLVQQAGDSKIRPIRSFCGFCVNSYLPVQAELNGETISVCPVEGSFLFISDYERFIPAEDVVIVGVENPENFRYIRRQAYLFPDITPLFVSRYPQTQSKDLIRWLSSIPNAYIHFGDFDPAGLQVFNDEYFPYLAGRAHFFVPPDIETLLSNGNRDRFDRQTARLSEACMKLPEVNRLLYWINFYKRGVDQEVLIL